MDADLANERVVELQRFGDLHASVGALAGKNREQARKAAASRALIADVDFLQRNNVSINGAQQIDDFLELQVEMNSSIEALHLVTPFDVELHECHLLAARLRGFSFALSQPALDRKL